MTPPDADKTWVRKYEEGKLLLGTGAHSNHHRDLEVRNAGEKGKGLFATAPIAGGTFVMIYHYYPDCLRRVPMSEKAALMADPILGPLVSAYGHFDESKQTLMYYESEEAVAADTSNYINHSCEPNLNAGWYDGVYCFVAKRDIAVDEEVTYDYREATTGPEWVEGFVCKCQSPNCIHRVDG